MKRSEQYVLNMGNSYDSSSMLGYVNLQEKMWYIFQRVEFYSKMFWEHFCDLKIQNVDYSSKGKYETLVKFPDLLCKMPLFRLHPRPLGCAFKFQCLEVPPNEKPKNFWTVQRKGRELLFRKCFLCANYYTKYFTYISSFLMPTMTLQKALFHQRNFRRGKCDPSCRDYKSG